MAIRSKIFSYRFLKFPDFSKGYCARSESVGLLHTTTSWGYCCFSDGFVRQLFSWGLGSGVLSCGLLGACHDLVARDLINDYKGIGEPDSKAS
jgi:hypothetical protein